MPPSEADKASEDSLRDGAHSKPDGPARADETPKDATAIEVASINNPHSDTAISSAEEEEEEEDVKVVKDKEADVTLQLLQQYGPTAGPLTPQTERRLQRKLWLTIFPMVFFVNFMLFLDKNAMGYASLLGLFEDANLTQLTYNDLQTIFYVGYFVSQVPSHYVFQRIPLSYYLTGVTFCWAFLQLIQLTADSFGKLAAIRFFLGFFEAGVTPSLEHTLAMWFTPEEQAIVAGVFWISCQAQGIPGGLISYGIQFIPNVRPWKIYWAIIGGLSFVLCVLVFFFYPDNPATYRYFSTEQRVHVIQRIKRATNSSIEQKVVKRGQVKEALLDPVTWLFGIFVLLSMLCNNISFQSAIIYKQLGLDNLHATLVSVASSGFSTVSLCLGSLSLYYFRSQTAHVGTVWALVALLGGILAVALPLLNNYGILAGIFLTNCNGLTFIVAFCWCQATAAGYTKRLVRTIVWSSAFGVVNLFAPQIWRAKDAPRYYLAWGIQIVGSWFLAPLILQVIRYILSRRNKERKQLVQDILEGKVEDENGYVTKVDENGVAKRVKVDVSMLDLTDLENKKFIYPL